MYKSFPTAKENLDLHTMIIRRVWVSCFDVYEENTVLAKNLWDLAELEANPQILCDELLKDVIHPVAAIQQAGAKALASLISLNFQSELVRNVLDQLKKIYMEKLVVRITIYQFKLVNL